MNLIALSFWNFVLLFIGFFVLVGTMRLVGFLANVSVLAIETLTYAGLQPIARFILAITVHYNKDTYCKNRLIYWNRVATRFSLFWSVLIGLFYCLLFLRVGHKVDSVWEPVAITLTVYLGLQTVVYFLSQHVKEQPRQPHQYPMPVIRPWNYIDELFAGSTLTHPA